MIPSLNLRVVCLCFLFLCCDSRMCEEGISFSRVKRTFSASLFLCVSLFLHIIIGSVVHHHLCCLSSFIHLHYYYYHYYILYTVPSLLILFLLFNIIIVEIIIIIHYNYMMCRCIARDDASSEALGAASTRFVFLKDQLATKDCFGGSEIFTFFCGFSIVFDFW